MLAGCTMTEVKVEEIMMSTQRITCIVCYQNLLEV